MPTHYFEVNNVRTKGSTAAVGTSGTKIQLSTTHQAYFQGAADPDAAEQLVMVKSLAKAMKLYDSAAITVLAGVVGDLVAAEDGAAEDTSPWQQRVGKGVWQITYGYAANANAAALTAAIAASVISDLA
jgi:hypothetical protein